MQRREFITRSCMYCIGAAALGLAITELTSCTSLPVYKTAEQKEVQVPLTLFAQSKVVVVRPTGSAYDILVIKKDDNTYNALLMKCTHRDNPLTATQSGLYCPAHGSRFDLNGNVTQEPATEPLTHYKTAINNHAVTVYII